MKTFNSNLEIVYIAVLNNSASGNPAYMLVVRDENGKTFSGRTGVNKKIAYMVSDTWEGETKNLTYHFTKNGNCIFDKVN